MRTNGILLSNFRLILGHPTSGAKIFGLPRPQINGYFRASPSRHERRVVTNARQDVGAPGIPVASAAKRTKKEWIASLCSQ